MNKLGLLVFNYNLRYIYKKLFIFAFLSLALSIFNVVYNSYFQNITILDSVVLSFGGYNIENINIIQTMLVFFPYIMIAMVIEMYMDNMMGKNAIFTLPRIMNNKLFYTSNIISMLIVIVMFFFIYDVVLYGISSLIFSGTWISYVFYDYTKYNKNLYSIYRILFNMYFAQIIGTFTISMVQLYITRITRKLYIGFVVVFVIYILNFSLPKLNFYLGEHILITKLNVLSNNYNHLPLYLFFAVNIIFSILLILLTIKNKETIIDID
ncbi:hypothetical protein [Thermoanaerobacterium sp. RBIITD]|uniref:hypothetical protein n=1 Tax=Thermoanaerobacterium sp. RBIITD TaxID=1550240 RepID=UPI000BB7A035|nr:hypothetical protein [Thermoanaerobacterium sp. RBIITD]SNX53258.1 hypothetical protein SAMN05660242_0771 [Thermoanaerobacterium sp. RBIITD]